MTIPNFQAILIFYYFSVMADIDGGPANVKQEVEERTENGTGNGEQQEQKPDVDELMRKIEEEKHKRYTISLPGKFLRLYFS